MTQNESYFFVMAGRYKKSLINTQFAPFGHRLAPNGLQMTQNEVIFLWWLDTAKSHLLIIPNLHRLGTNWAPFGSKWAPNVPK